MDLEKDIVRIGLSEEERALCIFHYKEKAARLELESYEERHFIDESFDVDLEMGTLPQFSILFSTANGLFHWDSIKGTRRKFLRGKFYGIAGRNNRWFFTRSNNQGDRDHLTNDRLSDVCEVLFEGNKPKACRPVLYGIPGEVHQVDFYQDQFLIPHTDFNQVLSFKIKDLLASKEPLSIKSAIFHPIAAEPFSHLNSIYASEDTWFLVAHNFSWKTGKDSEVIRYFPKTQASTRETLPAHSAHNYIPWKGEYLFCDSDRGRLFHGNQVLFEANAFFRGLSINRDYIFLGGSDICFDKNERRSQNSYIYIIDHAGSLCAKVVLPGLGDLYEIRQFSEVDFANSDSKSIDS